MDKYYPYMFGGLHPMPMYTYYDFLIVVDFEATCDDSSNISPEQIRPLRNERPEIIQFPAALIDVPNGVVVDYFDSYVKPVEQPILSEFCTSLTGITQDMVDKAPTFPKVLRKFERWLKKHGLNNNGTGRTFTLVTDGSFDVGHFLYKQCLVSNITFPSWAKRWVNIRTIFSEFYRQRWFSLKIVLELWMETPFEGRQHNGLDDAKNIAKVVLRMLADFCVIYQSEKIILDVSDQEQNEIRILNDRHAGKYDLATVQAVACRECILEYPLGHFRAIPPETDPPLIPPPHAQPPPSSATNKFENKENYPNGARSDRKKQFPDKGRNANKAGKKKSPRIDLPPPTKCGKGSTITTSSDNVPTVSIATETEE